MTEVHQAYADYVRNLLKPRVPSRDLPDLIQQSFIEINQGLPRYDATRPIQPWIATIVFRTLQRYVRRTVLRLRSEQSFSMDPVEFDPGSEDIVEARNLVPYLLACLKKRQLEMVLRHLRDDEPIDVISRDLGISTDGGYKLLQTALTKLQDAARRHEAIERRQLGERRALLLPFGLGLRVKGWFTRTLAGVKATIGSGGLTVALGVLMLPPFYPSAPASQVVPPLVAMEEPSAAREAKDAPAPVLTAAPLASSSQKRAAKPSSRALPASDPTAEKASLTRLQRLVETNSVAALAALKLHKNTFREEYFPTERQAIEDGVWAATRQERREQPRPRKP